MKTTGKNVLILGYGEMGHAMQSLLGARHTLQFWDKAETDEVPLVSLEAAAPLADMVIFCLPVNPHREIARTLAPLLKPGCVAISIAKGLDEAGQTVAQIFADIFGSSKHRLLRVARADDFGRTTRRPAGLRPARWFGCQPRARQCNSCLLTVHCC